jgi:hypothetical protein
VLEAVIAPHYPKEGRQTVVEHFRSSRCCAPTPATAVQSV